MSTEPHAQQLESLDHLQDDFIVIQDPEISPGQIVAEIRQRIQERRLKQGFEQQNFPSFGGVNYPGKPDDIPYDPNLYRYLKLANKLHAAAETEPALMPSPATRVPLLGRLWAEIRHQAHGLVLFYVNRAVRHQVNVNNHLVSVLNLLTVANQEQQRTILAMQDEIEELRSRLEG